MSEARSEEKASILLWTIGVVLIHAAIPPIDLPHDLALAGGTVAILWCGFNVINKVFEIAERPKP